MKTLSHTPSLNLLAHLNRAIRNCALVLIRAYQLVLSAWLGPSCRFAPSCSEYALEAIEAHGPWKGGWLAVLRISRCHPFGASGYDPVPVSAPVPVSEIAAKQDQDRHGDCHGH